MDIVKRGQKREERTNKFFSKRLGPSGRCYSFLVNKDNVWVLWEDKKGIQNKTNSPTRIFASITNVETTMSMAINCFAPSFIFYHLELLNILCFISIVNNENVWG